MKTTAAVSVTALDDATTAMYCSACGAVKVMAVPLTRVGTIRTYVTAHMNAEHKGDSQ